MWASALIKPVSKMDLVVLSPYWGSELKLKMELRWVYECPLASQAVEQVLVNEILYGASYGDPAYFVLLAKLGFGGNLTAAGEFARNYFLEDIVFNGLIEKLWLSELVFCCRHGGPLGLQFL
mgnify:CR=1 FL=1